MFLSQNWYGVQQLYYIQLYYTGKPYFYALLTAELTLTYHVYTHGQVCNSPRDLEYNEWQTHFKTVML